MTKCILLVSSMLLSSCLFANEAPKHTHLHALGSAWKNAQSLSAKLDKNDITMVYGGEDISLKPSLDNSTTLV